MSSSSRSAGRNRLRASAAVLVALATLALAAGAASAARTAASPSLAAIALSAGDLPGAKVAHQGAYEESGAVSAYAREFRPGVNVGHNSALMLENDVALFRGAAVAHSFYASYKAVLSSPAGRRLFTRSIVGELEKTKELKGNARVTFGRTRTLSIGDEAFVQPITVSMLKVVKLPFYLGVTRRDRITSTVIVMTAPGSTRLLEDVASLQRAVAARIGAALSPASTTPPSVAGAPVVGQVLTGSDGAWTNVPTLTRSWLRCDAAGNACVAIAGASAQTYVPTAQDAGATIRFSVVATNALGSATATSAQTAVVAAAPAA